MKDDVMLLVRSRKPFVTLFAMLAVSGSPAARSEEDGLKVSKLKRANPVDFSKELLPVLRKNCLACHNESDAESDLILESPATILTGGVEGPGIVAGDADESIVFQVAARLRDPFMPPEDNEVGARNLTADELGLLKLWIDQGGEGEVKKVEPIKWHKLSSSIQPILAVATSADGQYAAAGRGNQIAVYQVHGGREIGLLADPALQARGLYERTVAHLDLVQSLAFAPDGEWIASGGFRTVKLWRRHWKREAAKLKGTNEGAPSVAACNQKHDLTVLGTAAGHVTIVRTSTGDQVSQYSAGKASVRSVAISPNGKLAALADANQRLRVFHSGDSQEVANFESPAEVYSVALTDELLFAGGAAGTIRIWDLSAPTDSAAKQLQGHDGPVSTMAILPSGTHLATGGQDATIRVWNYSDGSVQHVLQLEEPVATIAISADGKRLAAAGTEKRGQVWNLEDGKAGSGITRRSTRSAPSG